jgi:predicted site-specific integrase-resolvase
MSGADGNFVRPAVAAAHFGVDQATLRRWASAGVIKFVQVPGPKSSGHRRYDISSLRTGDSEQTISRTVSEAASPAIAGSTEPEQLRIGYCRVSSIKQRDDLDRQIAELRSIQPPFDEIISDIGSGLNYKRKNFQRLLLRVTQGSVCNVTVTYADRLCRFGSELIEYIFKLYDCSLTVLHEAHEVTDEQELARDLMDIVHVFSSRRNGRRRYRGAETREGSNAPTGDGRESGNVSLPTEARKS